MPLVIAETKAELAESEAELGTSLVLGREVHIRIEGGEDRVREEAV